MKKDHEIISDEERMNKLLGMLHQNSEVNLVKIQEAFGYHFVEKNESKKKKLLPNEHLITHSQFINRMTKFSDMIAHYYLYNVQHLKALHRVMNLFPGRV